MTTLPGTLDGRAGVITGGAQGLGREFAEGLIAAGVAQLALFDVNEAVLSETTRELSGDGVDVRGTTVDVSDATAVESAFYEAAGWLDRIDFLVNNAGIRHQAPFREYALEDWQRTLDVDLTGPFLCSRAAIEHMLPQGRGKIVNITSIAGELALKNRVAYNVAKAGLIMLTKTIAFELGDQGIWCNSVAPGVIETPLTKEYFAEGPLRETILENTPLGRWGQPEDLTGPVVFLCGDASDFVQGHTLFVDGGWVSSKGY